MASQIKKQQPVIQPDLPETDLKPSADSENAVDQKSPQQLEGQGEMAGQAEQQPVQTVKGVLSKVPQMPKMKMPPIKMAKVKVPKKIIIGVLGVLILILVITILSMIFLGRPPRVNDIVPTGSSEPSATPTPVAGEESPYKNDPDILKIKEGISEYDKKLRSLDLREDTLRLPTLEWDVSFK